MNTCILSCFKIKEYILFLYLFDRFWHHITLMVFINNCFTIITPVFTASVIISIKSFTIKFLFTIFTLPKLITTTTFFMNIETGAGRKVSITIITTSPISMFFKININTITISRTTYITLTYTTVFVFICICLITFLTKVIFTKETSNLITINIIKMIFCF